jgi:rubrerythrin
MKKTMLILAIVLILGLALYPSEGKAQMGPGMMGRGPMMGPGMMGGWVTVPESLPTPKNTEWVQNLREILVLEKKSYAQYTLDAEKYNAAMPYMMVIPQEEDHFNLIERLFVAYGLKSDGKPEPAVETRNLKEAFELCARMEQELIPRYTWLVQNAEDRDSAQVLNNILLQTRMHLAMFQHALGMGGYGMGPGMMGGRGMGPGMRGWGMGPGMMGPGYGYQYGPQSQQPQKPLEEKDAKAILENYLRANRNPNLKLGKITLQGNYFEADIITKDGSLVDKILVDRYTGWIRSIY